MFGRNRRGGFLGGDAHSNPQRSRARHRTGGISTDRVVLRYRIAQTRGCHAFVREAARSAQALSHWHDLCGGGKRRRKRSFARVFAICGVAGRPAHRSWRQRRGRFRRQFQRSGLAPGAAPVAEPQPESGPKWRETPSRQSEKNYGWTRKLAPTTQLIRHAPGEAPQPLTLNHPAWNPGRLSGRGSSFLCASGYPKPTTRSSRWIISARPEKPRIGSISADARPLILTASSAS
jgi:hypothetical protein